MRLLEIVRVTCAVLVATVSSMSVLTTEAWSQPFSSNRASDSSTKTLRTFTTTGSTTTSSSNSSGRSRRDFIAGGALVTSLLQVLFPAVTLADAEATNNDEDGKMVGVQNAVAEMLHPVPTFTIVDKKGVPYMVVGEDAKVTGYFFTSYAEAERILDIANSSAKKSIVDAKKAGKPPEEIGENPWEKARISTVPLDFAVTLVSKSKASFGGGNYFKLAPAEEDVDDALALTGDNDLAEGKVPLFYIAGFTVPVAGKEQTPLYFRKSELEADFRRLHPERGTPDVMVSELMAVLGELLKPGGASAQMGSLALMAPRESEAKKRVCEKKGGEETAFFIGERIIVL